MDAPALYDAHKNMVYRLALSFLKSVPDAEDAVQQVFLRLIEYRGRVTPGKERQWLAAVTAYAIGAHAGFFETVFGNTGTDSTEAHDVIADPSKPDSAPSPPRTRGRNAPKRI